ncbi:MAG: type II toxin-antitoxin system VapC family toxin [Pseudomonadota bacterium]
MNIVDSCGWLEYIANGSNAGFFEPLLVNEKDLIVPAIVVFEVVKRLTLLGHQKAAESFLEVIQRCQVEQLDVSNMALAALVSVQYKLVMADAIIWQTAQVHQAKLYTQDADLQGWPDVLYQAKVVAK